MTEKMVVIYDGECPFCSGYVKLMDLRRRVGDVELVDARSDDPRVKAVQRDGYDLNEGMVAIYGARTYYGGEAVALISRLGSGGILSRIFGDDSRSRLMYPAMKMGRNIALRLLGRSKIP